MVTVDSDELVLLPLRFQVCFDNFDVPVRRNWAHPSGSALPHLHWGSPLPHLRRDRTHPCHICAGTGLTPATSALVLGLTSATSAPGLRQVAMRALLAMHILPSGPEAMVVSDKLRPHMPAGMSSDAARASESVRKRSLFSRPLAAPPTSTATTARVDAESLSRFIAERSADRLLCSWLVCGARLFGGCLSASVLLFRLGVWFSPSALASSAFYRWPALVAS